MFLFPTEAEEKFLCENIFCVDGHVYDIVSRVWISTYVLFDKYDEKITGNTLSVHNLLSRDDNFSWIVSYNINWFISISTTSTDQLQVVFHQNHTHRPQYVKVVSRSPRIDK